MSDFLGSYAADAPFGIAGYTETTYGDSFADVYDDWYADLDDADFMVGMVATLPAHNARILELGVGTGRLITQLLEQRSQYTDTIIGVDSSEAMLAVARNRSFPSNVELVCGDFSRTLPDGPFDAIFVGYNTLFNLPDTPALLSCLALVSERLSPNGLFHVDAVMPLPDEVGDNVTVRTMTTNEVVLSISSHNADEQRITGQFVQFVHGGQTRLRPWAVRYWTPEQLDTHASTHGLTLLSRHSDGSGTQFTSSSPRHVSRYSRNGQ
jgi:ubiquinone/menaquinone biosynthesis C-methylase UbiE